jgi:hypothetical protein
MRKGKEKHGCPPWNIKLIIMKVALKANFSIAGIEKRTKPFLESVDKAIINRLQLIGEQFVIDARSNGAYTDHTGNLRSSVRYFILKDGKIHGAKYTKAGNLAKSQDSASGLVIRPKKLSENVWKEEVIRFSGSGKKKPVFLGGLILEEIVEKYPKGYVLVCFAGMSYAAYVESRGLDVITSSSLVAENDLREAIKNLQDKISKTK